MSINTGNGNISIMTVISILSLSLVVNIPGLAITPVIDTIRNEFNASDFEVQLLTMLPNICILPSMLLSNRLIIKYNKTKVSVLALIIYSLCGLSFFIANSITTLIILSAILGAACGIIIPLAASMITDIFIGKYRVKELGIKSGIANISLVFATFIVGWLATSDNWRLPFLVYLIPIIPLLLTPGLHKGEAISQWRNDSNINAKNIDKSQPINKKRLIALMALYFFVTYSVMVLPYYLGLDENILHINDKWNSTITSIFYLVIFLSGFLLSYIIKKVNKWIVILSATTLTIGIAIIASGIPAWAMCACGALMGFGYGIFQPLIYNKTAEVAIDKRHNTLALSWVMSMNYLAIATTPLIIDAIRKLFDTQSNIFPFYLNAILGIIFIIIILLNRNSFVFVINKEYYS
ncbi:MAG: MFS transporter [Muribaculaceae bacterium]